jgi:hypothetical protein
MKPDSAMSVSADVPYLPIERHCTNLRDERHKQSLDATPASTLSALSYAEIW